MVITLIEIVSGFMASAYGGMKTQPVFTDNQRAFGCGATQRAAARRESFALARLVIRALINTGNAIPCHQCIGDLAAPALRTSRVKLNHCGGGVTVDHHTGQAIRFSMRQAHRVGDAAVQQGLPRLRSLRDTLFEKISIDSALFPTPNTRTYLRIRTERRQRQKCSVSGVQSDRVAGSRITIHTRNTTGKDPRVAALYGFFAALF